MAEIGTAEEQTARVLKVLQDNLRRAGRGTISRVEEELGLSDGYLRKRRHQGDMSLGLLLRVLLAIGRHPGLFFLEVFPAFELGEQEEPRGAPSAEIRRFLERAEELGMEVDGRKRSS